MIDAPKLEGQVQEEGIIMRYIVKRLLNPGEP